MIHTMRANKFNNSFGKKGIKIQKNKTDKKVENADLNFSEQRKVENKEKVPSNNPSPKKKAVEKKDGVQMHDKHA